MVNHNRPDSSKEIVLRFGLLIDKIIKDNTILNSQSRRDFPSLDTFYWQRI